MGREIGLLFLPSVHSLPGFTAVEVERFAKRAARFDWVEVKDEEAFLARLPEASVALVWYFKPEWQDRAPRLRFLSTPSAGKDLVITRPDPKLTVSYGSYHGVFMAETVIGMMLAFSRCIYDCMTRSDEVWPRAEMVGRTRHLRGAHLAVLGFGNIGKWTGCLAKPFGMRITGINRSNLDRPEYFDDGDTVTTLDSLDAVLPEVDHLVTILPGDRENDNIIDARRLALLPPHAYIYNIGRGNAIDIEALVAAIKGERLAGAGLDVFPKEPLPADSPVIGCPRIIRLPHISAFGPLYMEYYIKAVLPEIEEAFGRQ